MSAILIATEMLRCEAYALKSCHTLGDDWCGDPAETEYDEMIAAADAAITERDELRNALQGLLDALPSATTHPAIKRAKAAINRATGGG